MRPLLAAGPVVLALLAGACSETEDLTDYLADLASYIEDDAEIFGADVVPGADEPYRTLNEVPDEAPAVSSPEERAGVIRGLVADREKAQHTGAELRAHIEPDEPPAPPADGDDEAAQRDDGGESGGQVGAVHAPAEDAETADPPPPDGE